MKGYLDELPSILSAEQMRKEGRHHKQAGATLLIGGDGVSRDRSLVVRQLVVRQLLLAPESRQLWLEVRQKSRW